MLARGIRYNYTRTHTSSVHSRIMEEDSRVWCFGVEPKASQSGGLVNRRLELLLTVDELSRFQSHIRRRLRGRGAQHKLVNPSPGYCQIWKHPGLSRYIKTLGTHRLSAYKSSCTGPVIFSLGPMTEPGSGLTGYGALFNGGMSEAEFIKLLYCASQVVRGCHV